MRTALLFSWWVLASSLAVAQTAPAAPPPRQGAPAAPPAAAPPARPRAAAPAASRSGLAVTVTSTGGATLANVHVEVTRASGNDDPRAAETNAAGQVNFPGLPGGTYRLRFSGDEVTTFEREATLRAGGITTLQVALTPAPAAKKEAAPAPAAPAPPVVQVGPAGSPQWGSLFDLEKKAVATKPQPRELLLACSGNTRSTLLLLTEDQQQRLYADADSDFFVLDGQGSIKIGDRDGAIGAGSFVSVPRGQAFSITVNHRGNKPLVTLWVLSGERCETAR